MQEKASYNHTARDDERIVSESKNTAKKQQIKFIKSAQSVETAKRRLGEKEHFARI